MCVVFLAFNLAHVLSDIIEFNQRNITLHSFLGYYGKEADDQSRLKGLTSLRENHQGSFWTGGH